MASIDIAGEKFGRLTAVRMTAMGCKGPPQRAERWLFRCSCDGKEIEINKYSVTHSKTVSCGCLQKQRAAEAKTTHGHCVSRKLSPEYRSWAHMCKRCNNLNDEHYPDYAGRGITVCQRWADSFQAFFDDMGPKPSPKHEIDRIDNDGNYEPGNVRWATRTEQNNNRRNNRSLTINGRKMTFAEWEREAGIPRRRLRDYIDRRGFSLELVAYYIRRKLEARAA
jgi:hypothetical protein